MNRRFTRVTFQLVIFFSIGLLIIACVGSNQIPRKYENLALRSCNKDISSQPLPTSITGLEAIRLSVKAVEEIQLSADNKISKNRDLKEVMDSERDPRPGFRILKGFTKAGDQESIAIVALNAHRYGKGRNMRLIQYRAWLSLEDPVIKIGIMHYFGLESEQTKSLVGYSSPDKLRLLLAQPRFIDVFGMLNLYVNAYSVQSATYTGGGVTGGASSHNQYVALIDHNCNIIYHSVFWPRGLQSVETFDVSGGFATHSEFLGPGKYYPKVCSDLLKLAQEKNPGASWAC